MVSIPRHRARSARRTALVLAFALLGGISSGESPAEIVQRVGPDGRTFYSNIPDSHVGVTTGKGQANRREDKRRIQLTTISYDLPGQPGVRLEIGTRGTGDTCLTTATLEAYRSDLEHFDRLVNQFDAEATKSGHRSEPARSGFGIVNEEMEVVASIVKLRVRQCPPRDDYSRRRGDVRNLVEIDVEWSIYDGDRKPEFVAKTSGRYRPNSGTRSSLRNVRRAIHEAFVDAALTLLDMRDFVRLAESAPKSVDDFERAQIEAGPEDIHLTLATGEELPFQKRVRELKAATATIRLRDGHGSGFLIDEGYVLTNDHVVRGIAKAEVVIGQKVLQGRVVARNRWRDVALLEIDRDHGIEPLRLDPRAIETGETLYVIGTPLDESLRQTVTRGILSAERDVRDRRFYQTDASINPGNSGGPAFNDDGNVVAIAVSGVATLKGDFLNINFLIPIEEAIAELGINLNPASLAQPLD